MRGIFPTCCAKARQSATSGHAATALPSVMNSRLFIALPSAPTAVSHQNRKLRRWKLVRGAAMCAAQIPSGLGPSRVNPGSHRLGPYVSFRRLRTLRLARRVFGARLTRQPRLLRRKGDRPSATASPAPQTICRPEPQGIPRSSRPAAMARNDIAPPACSSLTTGASAAHCAARVCLTATEALISEDRLSAEQEPGRLQRHGTINGIILWNSICSRRFRKASRR